MSTSQSVIISPQAALDRLLQGNERFVSNKGTAYTGFRADLATGQRPFAVIVGCSDSRVPAEIVFDVGLGDLFVVRVAGNIVAPSQIGSVEFALSQFGTSLVVVMGHTRCGAVGATLRALEGEQSHSRNLASIAERIAPNIRSAIAAEHDPQRHLDTAVIANVRASVGHLTYGSRILEEMTLANNVKVVGAVYAVETGVVSVIDT